MGLFGGSKSTRTTTNQDNRVINDYANAVLDSSVRHTTDNSVTGEYAGNTGTINVVDGGAFELVSESGATVAAMASESLSLADSMVSTVSGMASESLSLADSLSGGAFSLASEVGDLAGYMLGTSLDASSAALGDAAQLIDGQAQHNLNAALSITEAGVYMSEQNNDLALNLAAQNGEALRMQNADNNNALGDGFKSMMQFADNVSRSDGANLAVSTNKTMMVVAGAAAVAVVVFTVWGRK